MGKPRELRRKNYDSTLTSLELAVFRLMSIGLCYETIATLLEVNRYTVKNTAVNIYNKMGADNRIQAVVTGIRRGIIDAGWSLATRSLEAHKNE